MRTTTIDARNGKFVGVRVAIAFTAVVAWAGLSPAPAFADPSTLECGSVITANTTLGHDVSNCPGDGLVIGADGVTVNLNGHTIGGDGVPNTERPDAGIRVEGHAGVTIAKGSVTGFDLDVLFGAANDGTVTALTVDHSRRGIVFVNHSDGARIVGTVATNNGGPDGGAGIVLLGSSGATIRGNTLIGNHVGVALGNGANGNTLIGNKFADNHQTAVEINFSDGNSVQFNRITGSSGGVSLEASNSTTISRNTISRLAGPDGIGIQIYGDHNIVTQNTVTDAIRYGIEVDAFQDPGHTQITGNLLRDNVVHKATIGIAIGPEAGGVVLNTRIERNVVTGANTDGIQLVGPSTGLETSILTRNVAVHNKQLGINALPGTIDGGGNRAHGNGDPRQCLNISCR
jgi:parallel beta-helix repeat protein